MVTEQMTDPAVRTLIRLRNVVVDAVREAGSNGVPESLLHVALLQFGAPPSLPKLIVDTLIRGDVFQRRYDRIYLLEATRQKGRE